MAVFNDKEKFVENISSIMTRPLSRLSLKSLSALLETISMERLRFVHSIFMNRFMDFGDIFEDMVTGGRKHLGHLRLSSHAWNCLKIHYLCEKHDDMITNFDQLDFATYCIGCLSMKLSLPQPDVYRRLKSSGILDDYIVKGYDILHTFSREYLMSDLISYMKDKGVQS